MKNGEGDIRARMSTSVQRSRGLATLPPVLFVRFRQSSLTAYPCAIRAKPRLTVLHRPMDVPSHNNKLIFHYSYWLESRVY